MRPFTVDDLLKLNQFAHRCPWDLSPDGELLAVTLSEANRREPLGDGSSSRTIHGVHFEANGAHLLLLDTATGESIVPFPDAPMSWAGRWSPDGQTLAAFVVAPQTQACVGLWDRRTREVRLFRDAVVHCGLNFCVPQWTPDGLRIVVALVPADTQATVSPTDPEVIVRSYDPKELDADQNQPFFQRRDAEHVCGCCGCEVWCYCSVRVWFEVQHSSFSPERASSGTAQLYQEPCRWSLALRPRPLSGTGRWARTPCRCERRPGQQLRKLSLMVAGQ